MENNKDLKNSENINQENKKIFKNKKSLAFSTIALILIIAVIAISVIFNIVFANLVPHNIDLTSTKEYSMSDRARDYLKTVKKEVEIIGLFDEVSKDLGTAYDYVEDYVYRDIDKVMEILNQFHLANNKIKVSYVNPEKNVLFLQKKVGAERAADFSKGNFLVMHGNKVKKITANDLVHTYFTGSQYVPYAPNYDAAFVSAIMYVTSEEDHIIGIVTDHREYTFEETILSPIKKELENRAYTLKEIKLATDDIDDCDILMFLGSKQDITEDEAEKLIKYLEGGGNAVFLIEAIENGKDFKNFNTVLNRFNLALNNDLIEEDENHAKFYTINLYEKLELPGEHPLSELNGSYLELPLCRSLTELKQTLTYLETYPIVYTSTEATSHDFNSNKSTEGKNLLGALVKSNATANESKIMVMGSTKFAVTNNTGLSMLIKTINWMDESEGGFFVPIKRSEVATINITPSQAVILVVIIGCFILLIFAVGTFVWLRRRHL